MKILIGIQSCKQHRDRYDVLKETWLKDIPASTYDFQIAYAFFIGGINEPESGEVWLPCLDTYDALAQKTRLICKFALDQQFDYLFKCDTDTIVNVDRLLSSGYWMHEYMGGYNEDNMVEFLESVLKVKTRIQFCSGGAGYWLNRRALEIVSKQENHALMTPAEDVFVAGRLRDAGIIPYFEKGYEWRPGSNPEGAITFHITSALQKKYHPDLMREYYQSIQRHREY